MKIMARLALAGAVAVAASTPASGQSLYGFGPVLNQNDYFTFTVDPGTGAFHRLATIGNRNFGTHPALDSAGRRLFILSPVPGPPLPSPGILTLHLDSDAAAIEGSTLNDGFLEYSSLTNLVYGLGSHPGGSIVFLDVLDPARHRWTELAYFPEISVRSTALDTAGQRLFFLAVSADGPLIYTVRLDSGAFSSVPAALVNTLHFSLKFDSLGRALYGVGALAGETTASLFSVDASSGSVTRLSPLSDVAVSTSAFDSFRRRLYFTTPPGTLSTFDLDSGQIGAVAIERCCPTLFVGAGASVAVPAIGGAAGLALVAGLAIVGMRLSSSSGVRVPPPPTRRPVR